MPWPFNRLGSTCNHEELELSDNACAVIDGRLLGVTQMNTRCLDRNGVLVFCCCPPYWQNSPCFFFPVVLSQYKSGWIIWTESHSLFFSNIINNIVKYWLFFLRHIRSNTICWPYQYNFIFPTPLILTFIFFYHSPLGVITLWDTSIPFLF